MEEQIKIAKAFHDCKAKAIDKINICFHPNCNEKSINSHILQKNGILSSIAEEGHVTEMHINKFKENPHSFRKIGINKAPAGTSILLVPTYLILPLYTK